MECPSQDCHSNVQAMKKTLYGNSGAGGLVTAVNKKISMGVAIAFLSFVLSFSGGFILYGLAAEKTQNKTVSDNTKNIAVIKEELKHISAAQREMKDTVKRIENKQMTEEKIVEAVKKAIRD